MKRTIYFFLIAFACTTLFGQAYQYFPYDSVAYSVPDDNVMSINKLAESKELGREIFHFDQVKNGVDSSTFASDTGKTCGLTQVWQNKSPMSGLRRAEWNGMSPIDRKFCDFNTTPFCAHRTQGAWFLYTVNFTKELKYNLVYRIRGEDPNNTNQFKLSFTLFNKSDISDVVWYDSVHMNGLDYTTLNSTSNDGKVQFVAHGNQKNPPPHQANSEYNMVVKTFEVTSGNTGEYVLMIDHYGQGTKNLGLGGFTFIPIIDYPILTMNIPAKATDSDSVTIESDKDCKLFMVPDTVTKDSAAFEAAVLGGYGKAINDVIAGNDTVIKFDGLEDGSYVFYGVITKDLISDVSQAVTLASDATPPSFVNLPMYPAYDSGSSFMVTVDEAAMVYLVYSGTAADKASIIADSITGAYAADSGDVTISTIGLQDTVYILAAIDTFDNVSTSKLIRIGDLTQKPYMVHTISLTDTTRIEAEHYDTGGYNVAYFDVDFDRGNAGDSLRPNDFVGLEFIAGASGPDTAGVGYIKDGEWLKYSVNISDAGYYNLTCRYTKGTDKKILFRMDGLDISDTLTVTNAGNWKQFGTISEDSIYLAAGTKVLEVHCITAEYNLDYFEFAPALELDVTAPVISVAADSVGKGTAFAVTADDTCTAYIVPVGTATKDIVDSAAYSVVLSANVAGDLATDTLAGNYMIYAIDSVGNVSNSIAVEVSDIVISVPQTSEVNFAIVPNPASNAIQIKGVNKGTFIIFNIAGQRALEGPINNNITQVNISGLTPGAYVVRVASGDMIGVERLIVK